MLETKRNGGLHMRRMAGLWAALLLVLALTSSKSRAPKAEGIPYDKGSR